APNAQLARFASESPFNLVQGFTGTLEISAAFPISIAAVRIINNGDGEFLMVNSPIASTVAGNAPFVLPEFTDGGGWRTRLKLLNPSDSAMTGTAAFFTQGTPATPGVPMGVLLNSGQFNSTFNYTVAPRGSFTLETAGAPNTTQTGSIRITPAGGTAGPFAV